LRGKRQPLDNTDIRSACAASGLFSQKRNQQSD
jgi:hypothetical protein